MADRYQDKRFPAADRGRGGDRHESAESDPLAELARLIGQTDPFAAPTGLPPSQAQPGARQSYPPQHQPASSDEEAAHSGPPTWMHRANSRLAQRDTSEGAEHPSLVHPLHRYVQRQTPTYEEQYPEESDYEEADPPHDSSRYDEALYGRIDTGDQDYAPEQTFSDDPYAYQDGDGAEVEHPARRGRGGLLTVAAILVLAVVGTGGAFAYRTYVGASRDGEPPIVRADNSPTKIVPAPADAVGKAPDRLPASGDGPEKLVSREEAPVDVNTRAGGARVVFPPTNQTANPPSATTLSAGTLPPETSGAEPSSGTFPKSEPRKIRTFSVRGEADAAAAPVTPPPTAPSAKQPARTGAAAPPPAMRTPPAPSGNAPLSLAPDTSAASPGSDGHPRIAAAAPSPAPSAPSAAPTGGGYLVQVASQRSESDAQATFRALQSKYPGVLGSQTPLIRRADLGDKGIYFRAMVGPFSTPEEASQFCGSLKTAGGQCVVQKN